MKILFIYVLFNVFTNQTGDKIYVVDPPFTNWDECALAINHTGPQKPDKDGNVKLFECVNYEADPKTTAQYTQGKVNVL